MGPCVGHYDIGDMDPDGMVCGIQARETSNDMRQHVSPLRLCLFSVLYHPTRRHICTRSRHVTKLALNQFPGTAFDIAFDIAS